MSDHVAVTGIVATEPRHIITQEGLAVTNFRLASMHSYWDRSTNQWRDGDTNWYSVAAFRKLAENAHQSIGKGDRVIVSGRLKIREWENGERSGVAVDIEAEAIGHDLLWGSTTFERNRLPENDHHESTSEDSDEPEDVADKPF